MQKLKLKGGALQLTLCIVVVIALLLMAFMLFTHIHNRFSSQKELILQTIKNSYKGVDYMLLNNLVENDSISIELQSNYKTLKVHRDYWGVFERVTCASKAKNITIKKMALVGGIQSGTERTALYLQDNNQPLVVVGNTKIKGLSYLPQKGVKSGSISGQSYYGTQLIYGAKKTSRQLPQLHPEIIQQIQNLKDKYLEAKPEQFLDHTSGNTFHNSFFNPTQFIFSNNKIYLSRIELLGNIIIQSKTKITVDKFSNLKDVILIAPEIKIQDDVTGYFQGFADKNITVGSNVKLDYSTALVLGENRTLYIDSNQSDKQTSKILIGSGSIIKGSVIYLGKPKSNNHESQIELQDYSSVFGEVYSNQNIDLKGTVRGSVYTNHFITKQNGSIYLNHIYNGTINIYGLSQEYVGVKLSNSKKAVVKWLY